MKLANVALLLGTSYVASAAELGTSSTVKFGADDKTLTLDADGELDTGDLHLNCEVDYGAGTAKHNYADMKSASGDGALSGDTLAPEDLDKYDSQTKLAYFCGVTEAADSDVLLDISSAPSGVTMKDGNRVLVKFTGGATGCSDKGTLALAFQDDSDKGSITAGVFSTAITSTITFDCRKAEAFTASVTADLRIKKEDAASFIAADAAPKTQALSRSDTESGTGGDIFAADWQPSYDLGVAEPHSSYYTSGGCVGGDDDLCFGALKTSSDEASQGADKATSLAAETWTTDAAVTYHKLSADACVSDSAMEVEGEVSEWDACRLTKTTGTGESGLLTPFDCPFVDGTSLSTQAAVDDCEAVGKSLYLASTCESSVNSLNDALEAKSLPLGDPDFEALIIYPDSDGVYFKTAPTIDSNLNAGDAQLTQSLESGAASASWNLAVTFGNDPDDATEIRVEEIGGLFSGPVTLDIGSETVAFTAPARSMDVRITGLVMTSCSSQRVVLGTFEAAADAKFLIVETTTESAGSFVSLGACDGRFEYSAGDKTDMKVVGVHAPGLSATVDDIKFCKAGKVTKGDCLADLPADAQLQQGDNYAVISKLCDSTAAGHVGGLIEMEDDEGSRDYFYAPVYCPGPCQESDLADLVLDWDIQFEASVIDGLNLLAAEQSSASFDGSDDDVKRAAYLASSDTCMASGRIAGAVDSDLTGIGCGIMSQQNSSVAPDERDFANAREMRDKFRNCSGSASEDPEVWLVQQMHVDLPGATDDLYFCHSQKVKLEIKEMTGEATATLAQIEPSSESGALPAIQASINSVGFEECSVGGADGYRLVAKLDVDASLVSAGVDYTADANQPVKFDAAVLSAQDDLLTFSGTSCVDLCAAGNEAFYADVYQFGGDLVETGNAAGSSLAVDFSVKVEGSPCTASQELDKGSVTLSLFGKAGIARTIVRDGSDLVLDDESNTDCDAPADYESIGDGEVAVGDHLCASLVTADMGDSNLRVLEVELTRKSPGSVAEVLTNHSIFTPGQLFVGEPDGTVLFGEDAGKGFQLGFEDAFTEYTLTVDWEQQLSQRRLRSVHVFGAADREVSATLMVLPAAAMVNDAEPQQADSASQGDAPSPSEEEEKFDWGSTGMIILYVAVGSTVLGMAQSYVRKGDPLATGRAAIKGDWKNLERPERKVYSVVRRSERFSGF